MGAYLLAGGLLYRAVVKGSDDALASGIVVVFAGVVIHSVALGARWLSSGHMPGDNLYELNSIGAWISLLIYLTLQFKYPKVRSLGFIVLAVSVLIMLYGISKPHEAGPLSDEYLSGWFYVHIISSFIAYGCYVIATAASAFILAGDNFGAVSVRMPSPAFLENLSYRLIIYGVGSHAVMLASGSVWANNAWGSYWNWDPVETWSLVTWLIYAFYLHAKPFLGWKGRRLAWVAVVALIAIIFTFWGIAHLPSRDFSHMPEKLKRG